MVFYGIHALLSVVRDGVVCGIPSSHFRILQGMSSGLLAPMAQMMMARAAGKHLAAASWSWAALLIMLALILGPVIAGIPYRNVRFLARLLFLINLPVGRPGAGAGRSLPPQRP